MLPAVVSGFRMCGWDEGNIDTGRCEEAAKKSGTGGACTAGDSWRGVRADLCACPRTGALPIAQLVLKGAGRIYLPTLVGLQ